MKTNHLTFDKLYDNKQKTLSNIFYNKGEKTIRFNMDRSQIPDFLEVRMSKKVLEPGDTLSMKVVYKGDERGDWGFLYDTFHLFSDDKNKPIKAISVSAHIKEYFSKSAPSRANLLLDEIKVDFGKVTAGSLPSRALKLTNTGKEDLVIRRVYSKCSCLEFEFDDSPIPPGTSRELYITFNTRGRIGTIQKEFTLITNSAKAPERHLFTKIIAENE